MLKLTQRRRVRAAVRRSTSDNESHINWPDTALWGFVGTVVLTGVMSGSQGLGLSRMGLPFMLGTKFTAGRDRG